MADPKACNDQVFTLQSFSCVDPLQIFSLDDQDDCITSYCELRTCAGTSSACNRSSDSCSTTVSSDSSITVYSDHTTNSSNCTTSSDGTTSSDCSTTSSSSTSGPAGTRIYPDGNSKQYKLGPIWRAVAMATLCAYMALIYLMAALLVLAPFSRTAATVLAVLCLTVLLPAKPVLWKPFILHNHLFKLWRLYFNYSLAYEQRLDDAKHYLYADYPHGVFPLSQLLGLTVRHHAGWEGERFYGLAADIVFRVPLWRHVMTWLGIVPASRANVRCCLKWGCAGLTPGGIAEMYLASPDADHIFITKRKGFIRMAVELGADIVPVYHFGNTQVFSFGPKLLERWGRRWRFSLGMLYGVAGLPIPRRRELMMVVGRPVVVVKTARESPEFEGMVEEAHQRYMAALQGLYDKYKVVYGWEDHPLIMH